jgi:hypothetical protein
VSDNLPAGPRIDRHALERIIQRAAELQAGERDIGEGLTEADLVKLGQDVGIPERYLQQAMLEERVRSATETDRGVVTWLVGPRQVGAERTIPGTPERIDAALQRWMTEEELLAVKRRYPQQTSWEPQQGAFASLRRGLGGGLSGRRYLLARAREVIGSVRRIDDRSCHVTLVADLGNSRREYVAGAMTITGVGGTATAIGVVLNVAVPVAIIPAVVALPAAWLAARRRLPFIERVHVALEQVLDRLEHPDRGAGESDTFIKIATKIRKNFG